MAQQSQFPNTAAALAGSASAARENEHEELLQSLHSDVLSVSDHVRKCIEKRSKDTLDAIWPHQSEVLMGTSPAANARTVNCITLPVSRLRPEAYKFSDIRNDSVDDKMFYRAVNFVMLAMMNPMLGTPFRRTQSMNFPRAGDGVAEPKWFTKVELLVYNMFEEGSGFIPTADNPGHQLDLMRLLETENRAGIRIHYITQDPNFTPDAAFAALMHRNALRAQLSQGGGRRRRRQNGGGGDDNDDDDEAVEVSDAEAERTTSRPQARNRQSTDASSFFNNNTSTAQTQRLPLHKLVERVTNPKDLALFVVYPLTGCLREEELEHYTPDYNIGAPDASNSLFSGNWMTLEATSQLLLPSQPPPAVNELGSSSSSSSEEPAVCAAQLVNSSYWEVDTSTGCLRSTFPCKELVWEFREPYHFGWEQLKDQMLPFAVSLLDVMIEHIMKQRQQRLSQHGDRVLHQRQLPVRVDSSVRKMLDRNKAELDSMRRGCAIGSHKRNYSLISSAMAKRSGVFPSDVKSRDMEALRQEGGDLRYMYEMATPKIKMVEHLRHERPDMYPRLLRLLRHEGLQLYMNYASMDADISEAMKHMLDWRRSQDATSFFVEITCLDPRLGLFINRVLHTLFSLDALYLLRDQHMLVDEALDAVKRTTHYWRADKRAGVSDLQLNIQLVSGPGVGKSMIASIIEGLCLPKTVEKLSSNSMMSHTGMRFHHDVLTLRDEPETISVTAQRKLTSEQQQAVEWQKSLITGHILTHRTLVLDKDACGKTTRRTETHCTEFNGATMQMTNRLDPYADAALQDRKSTHYLKVTNIPGKNLITLNSIALDRKSQLTKESFKKYIQVQQYLHTVVAKMVVAGALVHPNIELLSIYYNNTLRCLSADDPHVLEKVRVSERMACRALVQVINDAIHRAFFSEDSLFTYIDFQGKIHMTNFSEEMMLSLEPLLCLREDAAFKLISEYVTELFPVIEWEIVEWIARNLCNYVPEQPSWMTTEELKELGIGVADEEGVDNSTPYRKPGEPHGPAVNFYQPPTSVSGVTQDTERLAVRGSISKISNIVSTQMTKSSIDVGVVSTVLERLRRRVVRYKVKVPYIPKGQTEYEMRDEYRTMSAVEVVPNLSGGEPQLLISTVFVERSPAYYQKKVFESFRHKHLRDTGPMLENHYFDEQGNLCGTPTERIIAMGVTKKDMPYMLDLKPITAHPTRTIKVPNGLYMHGVMRTCLTRKMRPNDENSWSFDDVRDKETLTYDFDIERHVWGKHLESCNIPKQEWHKYYPEASDRRIAMLYMLHPVYSNVRRFKLPEDLVTEMQAAHRRYVMNERKEQTQSLNIDLRSSLVEAAPPSKTIELSTPHDAAADLASGGTKPSRMARQQRKRKKNSSKGKKKKKNGSKHKHSSHRGKKRSRQSPPSAAYDYGVDSCSSTDTVCLPPIATEKPLLQEILDIEGMNTVWSNTMQPIAFP